MASTTRTRTAKTGHRSRSARGSHTDGALASRRGARRGGSRGPSLEEVLVASWAGLCTDGVAQCPVCGEASLAVGGCRDCGSELS